MATMRVQLNFDYDTKRTRRFNEVTEPISVGTVYIQQDALMRVFGKLPKKIAVTVDNVED